MRNRKESVTNVKRYQSLDALKFVAAVLIIFHHYQQVFNVKYTGFNFYGGSFNFGFIVELFFILSGFFASMNSSKYLDEPFKSFIGKKQFVFCQWFGSLLLFMQSHSFFTDSLPEQLFQPLVSENT